MNFVIASPPSKSLKTDMGRRGKQICNSKKRYKTKKEGWSAATYVYIHYGHYVTPYHCGLCNQFHLTSRKDIPFPDIFLENIEKWLGFKVKETDTL